MAFSFQALCQGQVAAIEAAAYPWSMQFYGEDPKFLAKELRRSQAKKLSFLACDDEQKAVGYMIAYREKSEFDSSRKVIYIADLAVLPGRQGAGAGLAMFAELLRRLSELGLELDIELEARETTSLRALSSESTRRLLANLGWSVQVTDRTEEFGGGERTVWVCLTRS